MDSDYNQLDAGPQVPVEEDQNPYTQLDSGPIETIEEPEDMGVQYDQNQYAEDPQLGQEYDMGEQEMVEQPPVEQPYSLPQMNFQDDEGKQPDLREYKKQKHLKNKHIFRIGKDDLSLFFDKKNVRLPDNQGESRTSLNILKDCGYNMGLCQLVNTDKDSGIIGDMTDIKRRQEIYGRHFIAMPKIESFITLLARQFEDTNVIFLMWAATIYLGISQFSNEESAYVESLTIYSGLLFASFISATCDWVKERQFLKLKNEINNQTVVVYRGGHGTCTSIPIRHLVVGDIVDIQQGNRIPADCILIEEMNITVDESMYKTQSGGTTPYVAKEISHLNEDSTDNHKENPDPFLYSDTKVMTGQGKALVCAVGSQTLLARNRKEGDLMIKEQTTHLEHLLEKISKQIGKYAIVLTIISVVTHGLFTFFWILANDNIFLFSSEALLQGVKIGITAIVLLIVCIPEGLPLAVSIAMALSTNKMKQDNILIKNLESVQICAMLHDICVGKTGTLTEGTLDVSRYQLFDQQKCIDNDSQIDPDYFNTRHELHQDLKTMVREAIISNTDVRIEVDDKTMQYVPRGSPFEVGMIKFLMDNGEDVPNQFIDRNRHCPKVVQLPFDQNLKRQVVIRQVQGNPDVVRVYVKGAPEYVVPSCSQTLDYSLEIKDLDEIEIGTILEKFVAQDMAASGLKVISYAFRELKMGDLEQLMGQNDVESEDFREAIETELIYLGTFGMNDPLREDIEESIQLIRYGEILSDANKRVEGQVNIRVLSGDHIETAKWVAQKAGIMRIEELETENIALLGYQFQEKLGTYSKYWDPVNLDFKIQFEEPRKFAEVKRKLKIIARATAEDKFILISGIRQKGGLVGMTGESISDAEALQLADVGFCMGSGCDVAKDNSDLVILDNNFVSIHKSLKWGRSIFDNVRKFLQFQMTINITIAFITILGGATMGHAPLNVIQMLWTNLIMDILGAIAMCTEPYNKYQPQVRISRGTKVILEEMWRQILVQALYQILVLSYMMYFGGMTFFDEAPDLVKWEITEFSNDDLINNRNRLTLDTMCFHTFILMNLFNQINCRIIDPDDINIFKTLSPCNHTMFWVVLLFELAVQQSMIYFCENGLISKILGAAPLSTGMQITAWSLGAFSLIVNLGLKKIPLAPFAKIINYIDLESEKDNELINIVEGKFNNYVEEKKFKIYKAGE